ncbi:MAG TPA: VOC family protein [Alphaproteobacteria bacterium]|nr:VOC family protein [Alphaproteobacteria bacterium]
MVAVAAMFGSNDIEKAKDFYDALLGTIGLKALMEHGSGGRIYGTAAGIPLLSVVRPYDGRPASVGNGTMATLVCDSREQVSAIHARALQLGGRDEGAPGLRPDGNSGVFAAYFRDLDGNKICAVHFSPP